jgi:S1-C subfamily serine protease
VRRFPGAAVGAASASLLIAALLAAPAPPARAFDAKVVNASVVRIVVATFVNGQRSVWLSASGFVIAPELVATNHHVVAALDDHADVKRGGEVRWSIPEGSINNQIRGTVVWKSADLDLAVLRVPGLRRPAIALSGLPARDYPQQGETIYAIGFPEPSDKLLRGSEEAWLQTTITRGIVSKVANAQIGGRMRPIIQHDAATNPGNSGGAVVDDCNTVVGVQTFGAVSTFVVGEGARATGQAAQGILAAPHISNLIGAIATEPALRGIQLRLVNTPCKPAGAGAGPPGPAGPSGPAGPAGPPGAATAAEIPVWLYGAIGLAVLLALAAGVIALRKGTTREIVRVVESYSAWIRRGGKAGDARMTMPPGAGGAAAGVPKPASTTRPRSGPPGAGWVLSGLDTAGKPVRVIARGVDLEAATAGKERGLVLGRSSKMSDRVLEDGSVSRRHARLAGDANGVSIEDLGSAYGTQVNGKRIEPFRRTALAVGDRVALGGVTLVVSAG